MEIRLLRADEIECRVSTVKRTQYGVGCSLLLYKDARCDMNILDEVFGPMGWERSHQTINNHLFCTVTVYDEEHQRWISRQDVGTESYTEKEKGQASDSFKRACFNIGIGRELYTAPFVWVNLNDDEIKSLGNDKYTTYTHFNVTYIAYEGRFIDLTEQVALLEKEIAVALENGLSTEELVEKKIALQDQLAAGDFTLAHYIQSKTVESFAWAEYKDTLAITESGEIIDKNTGEVVTSDLLRAIEVPEEFLIK